MARHPWPLAVVVLGLLSGCARHTPLPPPAAPAQLPPLPGLSVLLTWSAPVDLDLYLTDPTGETVYFANTPSRAGARLLRDTRCGDIGVVPPPYIETADAPEPQPGRYRVGVDFIDGCSKHADGVDFRVAIELAGARREVTGSIRLAQFQPIVVEFDITRLGGNGFLVLSQEER
jgi:hypothetical protein